MLSFLSHAECYWYPNLVDIQPISNSHHTGTQPMLSKPMRYQIKSVIKYAVIASVIVINASFATTHKIDIDDFVRRISVYLDLNEIYPRTDMLSLNNRLLDEKSYALREKLNQVIIDELETKAKVGDRYTQREAAKFFFDRTVLSISTRQEC